MDDDALAELLTEKGLVTEKQIGKAIELMETLGEKGKLGEVVVRLGYMMDQQVKQVIKEQQARFVDISDSEVDIKALSSLKESYLIKKVIIPLKHKAPGKILLAMTTTADLETVENVQFMTNLIVDTALASKEDILNKLGDFFKMTKSGRHKEIEIVRGEESVLREDPALLMDALVQILIDKELITRRELFLKVKKMK